MKFFVITFVESGKIMIMRHDANGNDVALMNSDGTFTKVDMISPHFTVREITFFD